jgi:hypothetical protein
MTGTSLVALKTFKHNGGRPRKGLQIDVITVLSSVADRFAQACICTAIIGNTQRLLRAAKDRRSAGRFASAHRMGSAASSWRHATDRHPKLEIEILATARQFSLLKREADIASARVAPRATLKLP